MTLIFHVICKNCGFETKVSDNAHSITIPGLFIEGKKYHWTGFSNLKKYAAHIQELKKTKNKSAENQLKLKRELSLAKNREKLDIQTYKCPKCGKETLNWELIEGYET